MFPRTGLGQQVPSGLQGPPTYNPTLCGGFHTQSYFVTYISSWTCSHPICIPKRRHVGDKIDLSFSLPPFKTPSKFLCGTLSLWSHFLECLVARCCGNTFIQVPYQP